MTVLSITEECTYEVEGDSVYDAMRAFLRNPNQYLTGVRERDVFDQTTGTFADFDEVSRAEDDS